MVTKFNPGDSVICTMAPWYHDFMAKACCQFSGYGPRENEIVTVEFRHNQYISIKEYPSLDDRNVYGFHEGLFEKVMSTENLVKELESINERI